MGIAWPKAAPYEWLSLNRPHPNWKPEMLGSFPRCHWAVASGSIPGTIASNCKKANRRHCSRCGTKCHSKSRPCFQTWFDTRQQKARWRKNRNERRHRYLAGVLFGGFRSLTMRSLQAGPEWLPTFEPPKPSESVASWLIVVG